MLVYESRAVAGHSVGTIQIFMQPSVKRILAPRIIYKGHTYTNHIAELRTDGSIILSPFTRELPDTIFVSGTILLDHTPTSLTFTRL